MAANRTPVAAAREAFLTFDPVAPLVGLTQNPQTTGASGHQSQARRRADLIGYSGGQRFPMIDTFQTFLDNPAWASQWMADSVHPNLAGSTAWKNRIKDAMVAL